MTKSKVQKMVITPQAAEDYLKKNTRNRPFSKAKVEEYYREMKDGEWELSTDAIGFDKNGELINGQHRLMALMKYGKKLEFFIATGLEPESFNVIDTGKMRNAGDILGAHGIVAGHHKSAIVKFVMGYKKGILMDGKTGRKDLKITNQDVLDYAVKYSKELEEAYNVSLQVTRDFKGLKSREVGGMYWILSKIDRNAALVFFGALGTGTMLQKDNPIYVLRQRLMDDLAAKRKFPVRDKIAWLIIAWNHAKKNKKIQKLKWNGEKFPQPE